jgi:hypothetical protein
LDTENAAWNPPTPMPTTEGKTYTWNEETLSWDEHDYTPPTP